MIILNERNYAEECLRNKDLGKKPFYSLTLIARYYYHISGFRKKKIIDLLTEFMENYYPKYKSNRYVWDSQIEKIAKNAGKTPLFEVEGVKITSAELATIENIHNKVLERLAFTLLCIAKLKILKNPSNNGWVTNDVREIFNLARISCKDAERDFKIGDLYDLGLLEYSQKITNLSVRVTYINDDSPQKLFISDFRELGYEYLAYKGENFTRCQECGILIRNNKYKNKKYCKDCAGYTPKEFKIIKCVDCGKEIKISSQNRRQIRCEKCQYLINKEKKREWKRNNIS